MQYSTIVVTLEAVIIASVNSSVKVLLYVFCNCRFVFSLILFIRQEQITPIWQYGIHMQFSTIVVTLEAVIMATVNSSVKVMLDVSCDCRCVFSLIIFIRK